MQYSLSLSILMILGAATLPAAGALVVPDSESVQTSSDASESRTSPEEDVTVETPWVYSESSQRFSSESAPPPLPPVDSPEQPRFSELEDQIRNLSDRVDYFCKAPHDTLVKVPRIESGRELDASLEIIRSFDQPSVYAAAGEPLLVQFPDKILGGFKRKSSGLSIERKEDFLVLFAQKDLDPAGEALLVQTEDLTFYSFRVMLASAEHRADVRVKLSAPK